MSVIAERVKEVRGRRGLTAQELADRLKEAGVPWDRGTVTKLETKRRQNVSVVELLALARALHVAPVHLLVPPDNRPYQVTPNEAHRSGRARAWIRGEEPLPGTDRRIFRTEVPLDEMPTTRKVQFGGRHGSEQLRELFEEFGEVERDPETGTIRATLRGPGEQRDEGEGGNDGGQHREETER
ncbi:helix-turn-helix domain-containing protein [Streptomyces chitinivorans]|uniref:Helix-turn-helix domain-containing protein n=1 Tax=Streptomyces chitinivorans TaxID=1257027 RepID=A0ABW7HUD4_9ACTN|nr:helix-turn-helix transcriptional regulator [Streptomyces chitinivorans]MDH2407174.1 helix-turn-helix transcriptional regulator [Streptomyces chitinivorans]